MDEQILIKKDYIIEGIGWYTRKIDGSHFYSLNININGKTLQYMMEEDELDIKNNVGYVN